MRLCGECLQRKPLEQFRVERGRRRYECNPCRNTRRRSEYATRSDLQQKNRESCAKRRVQLHATGITLARMDELKKKFGMTPEEFIDMHEAQGGRCKICGDPLLAGKGGAVVDHCHASGRIRGLLCNGCNSGIGWFKEDPARMRTAILYLENDP